MQRACAPVLALCLLCRLVSVSGIRADARRECIHGARHKVWSEEWQNTAFVVGGMGKYGSLPGIRKCFALAETLGRIGGWRGNVYVITDTQPDERTLKKLHKGNSNVTVKVIDPVSQGVDFRQHNAGGGGGYLKTMIFELPDVPEDILIWHDCDKLIAEPDCISDMFTKTPLQFSEDTVIMLGAMPWKKNMEPKCVGSSWGKFEGRCGDGVHVGAFAAHRKWSQPLMQAWKRRQHLEPSVYDRYTFYDAMMEVNRGVGVDHLPTPFRDHMWNKGDVKCVNHISGPRAWDRRNRGGLEPLLESLCLRSFNVTEMLEVYGNCLKWERNGVKLMPRELSQLRGAELSEEGCAPRSKVQPA